MTRPLTILLTGFTSRQANTVTDRANIYITTSPMFAEMLRRLGHTVDWRPTLFGEDVTKYDIVAVGCSDPNSMTGMVYRYGGLWALATAPRLLVWFDDWRIKGQYHAFVTDPEYPWSTRMLHEKRLGEHAEAMTQKPLIDNALRALATTHKAPVMAQLFNWGDEAKFLKEVPEAAWLARFDISAFTPIHVPNPMPMELRVKRWASASLSQMDDHIAKLGLTWPVLNQSKPRGKGFGGWKKMREADLVRENYRTSVGVLCKPYSHAGSGWWRSRYNFAAQCRNVLLADPKEVAGAGPAYAYTARQIEAADNAELVRIADWQYETFMSHQDSQQLALEKLQNHLTRIMDEPRRPSFA